jgi:hypothetical protein
MTARTGLSLPGLPEGIALRSTENESGGTWTILYEWELNPAESITFMVPATQIEGLVKQAAESAERMGQKFSLSEARRTAADAVVVLQIRDTIAADARLSAWRS